MKTFSAIAGCVLIALFSSCTTHADSTFNHSSSMSVGPGGIYSVSGHSGQNIIKNLGDSDLQVTVHDQEGQVLVEQTLRSRTDCLITISETSTLKVTNNSDGEVEFRVETWR